MIATTPDGGESPMCQAIVALAKSLDLKTIAEGVETAAQRDHMLRLGCDELQGWLFSKAVPQEAFEAMLMAGAPGPGAVPRVLRT